MIVAEKGLIFEKAIAKPHRENDQQKQPLRDFSPAIGKDQGAQSVFQGLAKKQNRKRKFSIRGKT